MSHYTTCSRPPYSYGSQDTNWITLISQLDIQTNLCKTLYPSTPAPSPLLPSFSHLNSTDLLKLKSWELTVDPQCLAWPNRYLHIPTGSIPDPISETNLKSIYSVFSFSVSFSYSVITFIQTCPGATLTPLNDAPCSYSCSQSALQINE